MKICSKCHTEKHESEFGGRKERPCGLHAWCKLCFRAHKRAYRLAHRAQIREYERTSAGRAARERYRLSEKGKVSGQQYVRRRRERQHDLDMKLTNVEAQLVRQRFNNQCFNCGSVEKLEIDHHYPLSSGCGLTLKNAVLLCRSCNASKLDRVPEKFYTQEQLRKLAEVLV